MRIVLMVTMYKRHELTKFVFNHYNKIAKKKSKVEIILCAAGSEGIISESIAVNNGFNYIEVNNYPLSTKHNKLLKYAREFNPDAVVLIGSDDMLSPNMFYLYADKINQGIDLFGFSDFYMYDRQMYHWNGYEGLRIGESIGAGRMFSKRLLDSLDWDLWGAKEINSGLDGLCMSRLSTVKYTYQIIKIPDFHLLVGIKAGQSITPINEFTNVNKIESDKLIHLKSNLNKLNYLYE